jgi:hypothetical protein
LKQTKELSAHSNHKGKTLAARANALLSHNRHRILLTCIIVSGLILRLLPFIDVTAEGFSFFGTCGQLFDEAKPLFDSRNPLHFEVFYYPPVPAMLVASTALLLQSIMPVNFSHYCLLWNVAVSAATPLILYFIGRKWSVKTGLVAAGFYSVTMIAVYSSNNIQMYPTFFAMLALLFFYKSLEKPSNLNLSVMGVSFSLAVASKYFPILMFLMLVLVYVVKSKEHSSDRGATLPRPNVFDSGNWNFICNGVLGSALVLVASGFYLAVFQKPLVLSFFKSIYDGYRHENNFDYHMATIEHLYRLGLFGITGVGIGIAWLAHVLYKTPREIGHRVILFCRCHRLWLVPFAAAGVTILVSIGIPAALNIHNYLKYTSWIAKSYASADGGFFPAGRPAPSYFLSYFPENLGLPLFITSIIGLGYCLYTKDRKAILLLVISLPLYIGLEFSSVKVNRFSMDLMPLLCLFAAIGMVYVLEKYQSTGIKLGIRVLFTSILLYSGLYSLAWGNLQRSLSEVPQETGSWIRSNVTEGTRIGMRAQLWVAGSPGLLPNPTTLTSYEIDEYRAYPDIIVLPKLLEAIMQQYADLTGAGYVYRREDWSPLPPPAPGETEILVDLLNEQHYELIAEFERHPSIFGLTFAPQALSGKTWLLEHTGSYGIQVYRKRAEPEQVKLGSVSVTP